MSSAGYQAIIKEYLGRVDGDREYVKTNLQKLRKLKVLKAVGRVTVYDRSLTGSEYEQPMDKVVKDIKATLTYARGNYRRRRREYWMVKQAARQLGAI